MQSLEQLLNCPKHPNRLHYQFLPVSTSYDQNLKKEAQELLTAHVNRKGKAATNEFVSNQSLQNIKEDLIMLKLKGYIDPRDITGKATQLKKLPQKVQVGTVIDGDPVQASKFRNKKKDNRFVDFFLNRDKSAQFTTRKFTQIQRMKQRKKKIKKKILQKKKMNKHTPQK